VTTLHVSIRCVTDSELVERARDGDTAAFGELVGRHGSAVYLAALAVLGSPAEAEDVAQEAHVQAFRRLASFRGDASFKTWVVRIAWKRALNRRRSIIRHVQRFIVSVEESWPEPPTALASAEHALIRTELYRDARRLIRSLPSRLRDPFLMAATEEHTYEELAVILGMPSGTLKWRVSEARRVLREKLEKLGH
jgi:RNA polymerase sigma-70 factor (ECF subfamily)